MNILIRAIAIGSMAFITSCGSETSTTKQPDGQPMNEQEVSAAKMPGAEIDPICEMEKDSTWTEFSVYKQDTVWFCSEGCKKAFDARPEKYVKG